MVQFSSRYPTLTSFAKQRAHKIRVILSLLCYRVPNYYRSRSLDNRHTTAYYRQRNQYRGGAAISYSSPYSHYDVFSQVLLIRIFSITVSDDGAPAGESDERIHTDQRRTEMVPDSHIEERLHSSLFDLPVLSRLLRLWIRTVPGFYPHAPKRNVIVMMTYLLVGVILLSLLRTVVVG